MTLCCRYDEALVYLGRLREHHPSHMGGLCQLATCHMQLGHKGQARELFQEVLREQPNHTMALQNYGKSNYALHEGGWGTLD